MFAGFSCAQSSVPGIFMCCRLASAIQCPHELSTLMVNNNPRLCTLHARVRSAGAPAPSASVYGMSATSMVQQQSSSGQTSSLSNACPAGYTCMQSSVVRIMRKLLDTILQFYVSIFRKFWKKNFNKKLIGTGICRYRKKNASIASKSIRVRKWKSGKNFPFSYQNFGRVQVRISLGK